VNLHQRLLHYISSVLPTFLKQLPHNEILHHFVVEHECRAMLHKPNAFYAYTIDSIPASIYTQNPASENRRKYF
jgi:hypothetical protein